MESINVRNKTIVMSIKAVSIIYHPFAYAKWQLRIQNSADSVASHASVRERGMVGRFYTRGRIIRPDG